MLVDIVRKFRRFITLNASARNWTFQGPAIRTFLMIETSLLKYEGPSTAFRGRVPRTFVAGRTNAAGLSQCCSVRPPAGALCGSTPPTPLARIVTVSPKIALVVPAVMFSRRPVLKRVMPLTCQPPSRDGNADGDGTCQT